MKNPKPLCWQCREYHTPIKGDRGLCPSCLRFVIEREKATREAEQRRIKTREWYLRKSQGLPEPAEAKPEHFATIGGKPYPLVDPFSRACQKCGSVQRSDKFPMLAGGVRGPLCGSCENKLRDSKRQT